MGKSGFCNIHNSHKIRLNLSTKVLHRSVLDSREIGIAGVVDQEVNAPKFVEGGLDGCLGFVIVGNVEAEGESFVWAICVDEVLDFGDVAGGCDDVVTAFESVLCDGCSEAGGGSGNEPDEWCHFED